MSKYTVNFFFSFGNFTFSTHKNIYNLIYL